MRNRLRTGFAGPQKEWVEAPTPPFNRRRSLVSTRRRMPRSSDSLSRHGDNARNPGAVKRPVIQLRKRDLPRSWDALPLAAREMSRLFPSLWATGKAAERWTAKNPAEPY
jgi:hypothetical protein